MRRRFLLFAAAMAVSTSATTAQTLGMKPQKPETGKSYYVYNAATKMYIGLARNGTMGLMQDGTNVNIAEAEARNNFGEPMLSFNNGALSMSLGETPRADGKGLYAAWRIDKAGSAATAYNIGCFVREAAAFGYLAASETGNGVAASFERPDPSNGRGQWMFVSPADYDANLILLDEDDAAYSNPYNGRKATVQLKKSLKAGEWNTLCVPFSIDASQLSAAFGAKTRLARFAGRDGQVLHFVSAQEAAAGEPCLVYFESPSEPPASTRLFENVAAFASQPSQSEHSGAAFNGCFAKTTAPEGAFAIQGDEIVYLAESSEIKGFRAYFTTSESHGGITSWTLDGTTVGILRVESEGEGQGPAEYYNVAGQRTSQSARGIVIKKTRSKGVSKKQKAIKLLK